MVFAGNVDPPLVFIHGPEDHRESFRDIALRAGFTYDWPEQAPLAHIRDYDLLVLVVAADDRKVPWPECEKALDRGKEVLTFVIETQDSATVKNIGAPLIDRGLLPRFCRAADLQTALLDALLQWKRRHSVARPSPYVAWLRERTRWIEIRPFQPHAGGTRCVPIEDLYIELATTEGETLNNTLRHPRLLIWGGAGSGKTTFLHRIAYEKARDAAEEFPLLIRLADLDAQVDQHPDPAAWLPHYFAQLSREQDWGLDETFFHRKLTGQPTLVLFDGLDEAPDRIARLLENTAQVYKSARFVVTARPETRPTGLRLDGFHQVTIADLDPEDFEDILVRWTPHLHPADALPGILRARAEIRDIACNPAILTTLAIAPWHDRQGLPVTRAALYKAIVDSLTRVDAGDAHVRHPIFRDYLEARTCADLPARERDRVLFAEGRIYQPEWREPLRLLGGMLIRGGAANVDELVSAILDDAGESETGRIRSVGLLGHLLRDLVPLRYEPADPRYRHFLRLALVVFEPAAKAIDLATRVDAAEAVGLAGDPRLHHNNWVQIPACTFSRTDDRKTQEVELPAFRIARFPVTVEEYAKFLQTAHAPSEPTPPEDWTEQQLHPNRPVVGLSWDEAAAYCAWAGCRLATEAEWERAARGAADTTYPWGNELPDLNRANFRETAIGAPSPVGLFPEGRTPEGVADLFGNVWEWVEDWYGPYQPNHARSPRGTAKGEFKVLRGNSWRDRAKSLGTASTRAWDDPATRDNHVGFRCVREPLQ